MELKEAKRGDVFPGEGPEDEYVNGKVTTIPVRIFVELTVRRNYNARAS